MQRLNYLNEQQAQANLPEKYFTFAKTEVKYLAGDYQAFNTSSSKSCARGKTKLYSRSGMRPPIERFLDNAANSS